MDVRSERAGVQCAHLLITGLWNPYTLIQRPCGKRKGGRLYPFKTAYLPLNYDGNPEVNVVSDRGK